MTILPVAEFMPDQPDLADATTIALNVIPVTASSYGPVRDLFAVSSNAVQTPILGMGAAAGSDLTQYLFVGNDTTIQLYAQGGTTFADVSRAFPDYGAYPENWRFAQFNNLMLATDFNDAIQSYTMGAGGLFANLSATAPRARHIAVAKNFVIVANTYDPTGLYNPARVWWSANNDPTNWPLPGSLAAQQVQSDYNDLNGPMGAITGLAPNLAGCDCAIFFERGVFRMIYAGPPVVFDFYPAASVRGTNASNSIVPLGQVVYYFGEDGFYAFDGTTSIPIGANKVDKWFLANADLTFYPPNETTARFSMSQLVIGAADVNNKAIIWQFRMNDTPVPPTAQPEPTHALVYRYDIQRWSLIVLPAQWVARIPAPNYAAPTTTAPLSIAQGQLQLIAMGPATGVVFLTNSFLSYFSGPFLTAEVGSKVVQINQGFRSMLTGVRPLVNSGTQYDLLIESGLTLVTESGDTLATEDYAVNITVAVSARATYQDPEVFSAEEALDVIGNASFREDGRYHRARITVDANITGIWSQLAGFDVDATKSGQR